jgi:hypothetical protein
MLPVVTRARERSAFRMVALGNEWIRVRTDSHNRQTWRSFADLGDLEFRALVDGTAAVRPRHITKPLTVAEVFRSGAWTKKPSDVVRRDTPASLDVPDEMRVRIVQELERSMSLATFESLMYALRLAVEVGSFLGEGHAGLVETIVASLSALERHLVIHVVTLDPALGRRLGSNRIALGFSDFPELFDPAKRPDHFAPAESLADRIHTIDKFMFSPWTSHLRPWALGAAFSMPSIPGPDAVMIVGVDEHLWPGDVQRRFSPDLLDQNMGSAFTDGLDIDRREGTVQLPAGWYVASLNSWIASIGKLLATLADPRYFPDEDGYFDPRAWFDLSLDVGRLLTLVTAAQAAPAGWEHLRRPVVFDALDCLDALLVNKKSSSMAEWMRPTQLDRRLRSVERHLGLKKGDPTRDRLRLAVASIKAMMPRFDAPSLGTLAPDVAVGQLLEALRQAYTHSFHRSFSYKGAAGAERRRLMYAYTGPLTSMLDSIAYLFLLDVLCDPTQLTPLHQAPERKARLMTL